MESTGNPNKAVQSKSSSISKKKGGLLYRMAPMLFYTGLLLLWQVLTHVLNTPEYKLPSPYRIAESFARNWRLLLLEHAVVTIAEALIGFLLATAFAVVISFIMSNSPLAKRIFYPLAVISQNIPVIALAPLIIVWFGLGILSKILVVILVCFFPIMLNLTDGLLSYDSEMVEMLKMMKADKKQIFLKVQLPAALPGFFAGLKIASAYSIMGAVVSEWIGGKNGLGLYMTRAIKSFNMAGLFADIVIIVVVSLLLFECIVWIERKVIFWDTTKK